MLIKEKQKEICNCSWLQYREAFSLRDGDWYMSPILKLDIQVIDRSPFFIRLFHVKEEDKPVINKERQMLVHLGIVDQDISPYCSPIMLNARKNSNFKRNHYRFIDF